MLDMIKTWRAREAEVELVSGDYEARAHYQDFWPRWETGLSFGKSSTEWWIASMSEFADVELEIERAHNVRWTWLAKIRCAISVRWNRFGIVVVWIKIWQNSLRTRLNSQNNTLQPVSQQMARLGHLSSSWNIGTYSKPQNKTLLYIVATDISLLMPYFLVRGGTLLLTYPTFSRVSSSCVRVPWPASYYTRRARRACVISGFWYSEDGAWVVFEAQPTAGVHTRHRQRVESK